MRRISLVRYHLLALSLAMTVACNNSDFTKKHSTADEVMRDFYEAKDRAEDMLMDPLIVNSDIVKHRVIEEIKDKSMNKRRYAIGYLGNEKVSTAVETIRLSTPIIANPASVISSVDNIRISSEGCQVN